MNRWTDYLLIPFLVFLAVLALWGATALLLVSAAVIAQILQNFTAWIFGGLPQLLFKTFTDPWKVVSLPIAVGVLVMAAYWLWNDLNGNAPPQVMRGRELGTSRSQPRFGRSDGRKTSSKPSQPTPKKRWTRSSLPRR